MTFRITHAQMQSFESAHFASRRTEVAGRAQERFPSLFADRTLPEVETFAQACHDGSQAMGGLQDFERLVEFMAVNALASKINGSSVTHGYFRSIVKSETWSADQKVYRLFLDCASPFLPDAERVACEPSRVIT